MRDVLDVKCKSHTTVRTASLSLTDNAGVTCSAHRIFCHALPLPQLRQHQSHAQNVGPKKFHSHSTCSVQVVREHALTSPGAGCQTPPADESWSGNRRPACPVNEKADANHSQTRRKRWNHVEEVRSFMKRSPWTEKGFFFYLINTFAGHNKRVQVDDRSLFQH